MVRTLRPNKLTTIIGVLNGRGTQVLISKDKGLFSKDGDVTAT